jgi:FixJ family two-component response regulator
MTDSPATGPLVFIVDDDASMLRALSRLLTLAGYVVEAFASAPEFLARHRPSDRGCVLADLRMPHMSGLELQAALARSGNPLPVIFLTAHGDIPTSVQAIKGGAEDFLTKPVPKEKLLAAVQRALAQDATTFGLHTRRRELQRQFDLLTPRQREVLALVVTGKLNKEIADKLGAAEGTIKAHRASIMEKFQVHSPVELGRLTQELDA